MDAMALVMLTIPIFYPIVMDLVDILEAKEGGKNPWKRWYERLVSFCERKFDPEWQRDDKEFLGEVPFLLEKGGKHLRTELSKTSEIFTNRNSAFFHCLDFSFSRTAFTADNGPGMPHAPTGRRS